MQCIYIFKNLMFKKQKCLIYLPIKQLASLHLWRIYTVYVANYKLTALANSIRKTTIPRVSWLQDVPLSPFSFSGKKRFSDAIAQPRGSHRGALEADFKFRQKKTQESTLAPWAIDLIMFWDFVLEWTATGMNSNQNDIF